MAWFGRKSGTRYRKVLVRNHYTSQVFGLVKVGLREFSFGVTGSLEIGDLLGSPTGNEY